MFMIISHWILLKMRNISDKSCKGKQNTYLLLNNSLRKSFGLRNSEGKYGRARQVTDDSVIRRMCFVCWIIKDTHTHTQTHTHTHTLGICTTYCFYTARILLRTHLIYFYTCIECLLFRYSKTLVGQELLIIKVSRPHLDTPHPVGLLWTSDRLVA